MFNCSEYSLDELERMVDKARQLINSESGDKIVISDAVREDNVIMFTVCTGNGIHKCYVDRYVGGSNE